jgi:bifunctional oligoribonuclease and PAP phosphatase NrnA
VALLTNRLPGLRPLLSGASKVVVTCHANPDGDAVAGSLALSASLRLAGWDVVAIAPSPVPLAYRFLPGWESIAAYSPGDGGAAHNIEARSALLAADVIICLDATEPARLGSIYADLADRFAVTSVVNIDHHPTNTHFGTHNLVDPQSAATCEMLASLIERDGLPVTTEIATALLVGIVTDTLGFRTPSTTASTLRTAATLMEWGASLSEINERIFNTRSLPALRLWGQVLSRARTEDGLVWADITGEMLEQCGATLEDADMLVDFIRGVPGTVAAFLFSEQDGKVRVSMRTSVLLSACDLAGSLGGGGHARAAGCTLSGSMAEVQALVVGEARRRLGLAAESGRDQEQRD